MNVPEQHADRVVLTRRGMLAMGTGLVATSAAGCGLFSTEPSKGKNGASSRRARKGAEAPILAERVRAGDLPPVSERLPKNPLVVEPTDSVGGYGGAWQSWIHGLGGLYVFGLQIGYDNLVRWDPWMTEVVPNLAESWEVRKGGLEYVFHLREATRWSDGEPFNADDLVFTYNDLLLNRDLYPAGAPSAFIVRSGPASLEKIDDYTVRFAFPSPSGLFLDILANTAGGNLPSPRHYLEQFHKKYNDNVETLAEEEGFDSWVELLLAKNDWMRQNPDLPVIFAWVPVSLPGEATTGAEFERNPYYWKTDPEGSQLPYLDRVTYQLIGDLEVALLKTTNGEIDLNAPTIAATVCTPGNKPILARNRENGEYKFIDSTFTNQNEMAINLNLTHKNQQLREVFQNKDFRIGLSYAINRQELIDAVFQRQGEPWQVAQVKDAEISNEELAKQYTDYDVDKANTHLDQAGYTERDSEGFRLRPDGERISFMMEVATEEPDQISALELVQEYWLNVGVEMRTRVMDRTLFLDRTAANEHDANVWTGAAGAQDAIFDPRYYFPYKVLGSKYAPLWAAWYSSGGEAGEEPPEAAKQQMQLYDRLAETTDKDEQTDLFIQILDSAKEQFWVIGTVLPGGQYGTVKNDFRNVPRRMFTSYLHGNEGPTRPEQYYKVGA